MGPGLRKTVLQRTQRVNLRSEGGLHIGERAAINFEAPRIRRVVERIVLGLLWEHYTATRAPGSIMQTYFKPNLSDLSDIMQRTTLSTIGDTIFRYRHGRAEDDPDSSVWGLQFYEHAHFLVLILGESYQKRYAETKESES